MHELPITQNILRIATDHAVHSGATRVTDLHLVIGQLSSIVDDSIQFYWDIISKGTLCEGAILHFERIPARMLCRECGTDYGLERELQACPTCQSARVQVIRGEEFRLESIEVETGD